MAEGEVDTRLSELQKQVGNLLGDGKGILGCSEWDLSGNTVIVKAQSSIDIASHCYGFDIAGRIESMAKALGFSGASIDRLSHHDLKTPNIYFHDQPKPKQQRIMGPEDRKDMQVAGLELMIEDIKATRMKVNPPDRPEIYVVPPNNGREISMLRAAISYEGVPSGKKEGGIFLLRGAPSSGKSALLRNLVFEKTRQLEERVSNAIATREGLDEAEKRARETVSYLPLKEFSERCTGPFREIHAEGRKPGPGEASNAHAQVLGYLSQLVDSKLLVIDGNAEELLRKRSKSKYTLRLLNDLIDKVVRSGGYVVLSCRSLPSREEDIGGNASTEDIALAEIKNTLIDKLKLAGSCSLHQYSGMDYGQRRDVFLKILSARSGVSFDELDRYLKKQNSGVAFELAGYLGGRRNYADLVELTSLVAPRLKRESIEDSLKGGLDSVFGEYGDRYPPEIRLIADSCEAKYAACSGKSVSDRLDFFDERNHLATCFKYAGIVTAYKLLRQAKVDFTLPIPVFGDDYSTALGGLIMHGLLNDQDGVLLGSDPHLLFETVCKRIYDKAGTLNYPGYGKQRSIDFNSKSSATRCAS